MAIEELQIAFNRGNRSATVVHLTYSVLKKHLLHKAQNVSLPTIYKVFKCRSLSLRLLKVAVFTRQKWQTVISISIHSIFERSFRISLKAFSLWSQECCNQNYAILIGPILTKWCEFIKNWPSSTSTANTSWKAPIRISSNQNFLFFNFPRNLFIDWISQSTLSFFVFRLYKIPVMIAGSCYPSSSAAESAL